MKSVNTILIALSLSGSLAAQSHYVEVSGRGLVKSFYSQASQSAEAAFHTWLVLKGTSERASCPELRFAPQDLQGIEIAKLAIRQNRPVEVNFHISREDSEQRAEDPGHCEITRIELRP
ncbi:hypothetical protein [Planctobacterium marinum]|uniref:hypothetical protein n=1 Tax=Planctobacterium marinum TaxID=1631968 RepID=UPI001E5ADE75|nr:hypothetical protein [Planctobacterium marinum]MCC2607965.1 hypothetical protein [Planctobacterium marinum]